MEIPGLNIATTFSPRPPTEDKRNSSSKLLSLFSRFSYPWVYQMLIQKDQAIALCATSMLALCAPPGRQQFWTKYR